jgi:rubrerythrin
VTPLAKPSRRDLLRLAAAAPAATWLAACGGDDAADREARAIFEPGPIRDARILNSSLSLEYTAIAAYRAGLPLLRGSARLAARRFLDHERAHAADLARIIRDLDGEPNQPRPREEYLRSFPELTGPEAFLRFAVDLENLEVQTYGSAIPKLSTGELRQAVAPISSNEAEHISVLLGELYPGDPTMQVPQAFVTGVASAS